jgi:hypothetical protein
VPTIHPCICCAVAVGTLAFALRASASLAHPTAA